MRFLFLIYLTIIFTILQKIQGLHCLHLLPVLKGKFCQNKTKCIKIVTIYYLIVQVFLYRGYMPSNKISYSAKYTGYKHNISFYVFGSLPSLPFSSILCTLAQWMHTQTICDHSNAKKQITFDLTMYSSAGIISGC